MQKKVLQFGNTEIYQSGFEFMVYLLKKEKMDILSEIKRMKNMMLLKENDISQIDPRSNYIFGSQEPTWGGGPNSHQSRHPDLQKNDWESCNAYDIMAPDGTPVYSITNGIVVHVKRRLPGLTAIGGKRVYGDSVTIRGVNGDPQIFYTHLENIVVEKNQDVKKGDLIGFVMKGVQGIPSHTHIGVEYGFDVKRYVDLDGKIKDLPDVLVKPKEEDKKIEGDLADNLGVAAISTATVASVGLQGSETNIKGLASRLGMVDADINMDSVSGVLNKIILSSEGIGTDETGIHDAIKKLNNCSDLEKLNQMVKKSPIDGKKYNNIYDYINSEMDYGDDYFVRSLVKTINNFCPGSVTDKGNQIIGLTKSATISGGIDKVTVSKLILDLKSMGLSDNAAKGLAANAYGESGFNVKSYGDGGGYADSIENSKKAILINGKKYCSFGLWQYNVCGGMGLGFLKSNGINPENSSDEQKIGVLFNYNKQLSYMAERIKQEQVRGEKDVATWISWIVDNVERPSDKYGAKTKRLEYARSQKWI